MADRALEAAVDSGLKDAAVSGRDAQFVALQLASMKPAETAEQLKARLDAAEASAKRAREAVSMPVIVNGDVKTASDAERAIRLWGATAPEPTWRMQLGIAEALLDRGAPGGQLFRFRLHHRHPFVQGEDGILGGVDRHTDHQMIDQLHRPLDDIQMTQGHRIEGARIKRG